LYKALRLEGFSVAVFVFAPYDVQDRGFKI